MCADKLTNSRCRQPGFSLLELVLVILVLSMLSFAITQLIYGGAQSFVKSRDNIIANSKLRMVVERLSREIRRMDYSGGQYQLSTATASQLVYDNIDGDTVSIDFSAGSLSITYASLGLTATLSDGVDAFAFAYYEIDGTTPTVKPDDIAFVDYSLTVSEGGVAYSSRDRVALRDRD